MNAQSGTYALILRAHTHRVVRVGQIGCVSLTPGYYVYVGSAFGPGGIRARLAHHVRISRRPHWHIDFVRRYTRLEEGWCTTDPCPREHEWARLFGETVGASEPLRGFGASDCRCRSHLFRFGRKPSLHMFCRRLELAAPGQTVVEVVHSDDLRRPSIVRDQAFAA